MSLLQYGQAVGDECPLVVASSEGGVHAVDGCLPFHGRAVHLRGIFRSSMITEYSLPGSLQILSGNQPYLHVYALASDIHLSIAFLAAFFVLESLGGNTIKIILEDDRSCDCALRCIDELPHRTEPLGIHIQNLAGVRLQNRKGFR